MIDQATELRKLVLRSMRERTAAAGPPSRLLVLAGGKPGVGVTTLAVNLAIGLADQGLRVVVVDADLYRNDVALLCGVGKPASVVSVVTARPDIHELLQRGPAGIQIVPALWKANEKTDVTATTQERLLRQFRALGLHADVVLLDVGSGVNDFTRRFSVAADDLLLITTPSSKAILGGYARIKTAWRNLTKTVPWLVVNFCGDAERAAQVHRPMNESCERFLGTQIRLLGYVPDDEAARRAATAALPFLLGSPACPAGRAVQRLAVNLAANWPDSFRHVA